MRRIFLKKIITAIIFIIILFIYSFENFKTAYKPIVEGLSKERINLMSMDNSIESIDGVVNDNTYKKFDFIELYGYLQKLMYKNEESNFEVVKDKNGFLHYTFFAQQPNPVYSLVKRTKAFKKGLKDKNTKFIYLMPPDKYIEGYTKFPYGIPYSFSNETADVFLKLLRENNINIIDLRNYLNKSNIPYNKLFYKTDHHWTTQTAFFEFTQLVNILNKEYGLKLDPENFYTNKNNYNFITYKNSFIGSLGRKTGITYSGVDDFTLIYPKFETSYNYYSKTGDQIMNLQGRFEDSLLSMYPFRNRSDKYSINNDKYSSYLYGNQGIVHVTNKNNPGGPKILFVKDSYIVPVAAFLSTVCSDVYLVDPRYYKGSIPDFVNSVNTDFVFMSFYPQDLTSSFFNFYQDK